MLTETAIGDRIVLRFERVFIGSGDGYFAGLIAWLAAAGVRVTVDRDHVSQPEWHSIN